MDMDNELEEFERTGTPSLVGLSIRGETSSTNSRLSSKPNIKVLSKLGDEETSHTSSLEELQQEGVLLQEEDELDLIMDKEGHIISDLVEGGAGDVEGGVSGAIGGEIGGEVREGDSQKNVKLEEIDEVKPPLSLDVELINSQEEGDEFRGHEEDKELIAPASSRDGSHSRSPSVLVPHFKYDSTKPLKNSPLNQIVLESSSNSEQDSLNEIINEVNNGEYHPEGEPESLKGVADDERKPRSLTRSYYEEPQVPDMLKEVDAEFAVPAASRDGSKVPESVSKATEEATKTPEPTGTPSIHNGNGEDFVESAGLVRPHLLRGDSYQNTVTNNDFNNTAPLFIGERRSRTSQRDPSSLNYLRSISRSRSRIDNDRKLLGEDRGIDENELKEEGALTGDHYDQLPELEDAVDRLLRLVQQEMESLGFETGIPEEDEEEDTMLDETIQDKDVTESGDVTESKEKEEEVVAEGEDKDLTEGKDVTEGDEAEISEVTEGKETENSEGKEAEISEGKETEISEGKETKPEEPEESEETQEPEVAEAEDPVESKESSLPEDLTSKEIQDEPASTPASSMSRDGSVFVPKTDKLTYEDEPVYLYTSLAGGFQIANRTNRMTTILAANGIKYQMRDLGTDVEAKKIWRRYSGGKTMPGIVRGKDDFIGNWEDLEEANENYEVRSLIYETA